MICLIFQANSKQMHTFNNNQIYFKLKDNSGFKVYKRLHGNKLLVLLTLSGSPYDSWQVVSSWVFKWHPNA